MTIQTNIFAARESLAEVTAHCMAAKVENTDSHLIVTFPPGYQLDGVRVSKANGMKWACGKALEKMELAWRAV